MVKYTCEVCGKGFVRILNHISQSDCGNNYPNLDALRLQMNENSKANKSKRNATYHQKKRPERLEQMKARYVEKKPELLENRPERLEQMKALYVEKKPERLEQMKARYVEKKPEILQKRRKHYVLKRPVILAGKVKYYRTNRSRILSKSSKYYQKNKKAKRIYNRKYYKKNKSEIKLKRDHRDNILDENFPFGCTLFDKYERPFKCATTCFGKPCGKGCICIFCEPQCKRYRHFIAGTVPCPVCDNNNYKIRGYKRIKCHECKFAYCYTCYVKSDGDPEKCKVNKSTSFAFEHFYIQGLKHIPNLRCKLFSKDFEVMEDCQKCEQLLSMKSSYIKKLRNMKSVKTVKKEGKTVSIKENKFICPRSLENNSSDPKDLGIKVCLGGKDEHGWQEYFDKNGSRIDWRSKHEGWTTNYYKCESTNLIRDPCDCNLMLAEKGFKDLRKEQIDCFKPFKFFCEFKEHMDNHDVKKGKTSLSLHVHPKNELLKDNDRLEFANTLKKHFENNEDVYGIHSIKGSDNFLKPPLDVILILKRKVKIDDFKDVEKYPKSVGKVSVLGPKPLNDAKEEFLEEEIIQQKEFDRVVKGTTYFSDAKPLEVNVYSFRRKEEEAIQFHDKCHVPLYKIDQEPVPNCTKCDEVLEQGFLNFERIKPQAMYYEWQAMVQRKFMFSEGLNKFHTNTPWRYPRDNGNRTVFKCVEKKETPCEFYSDHLCNLALHQKEHESGRNSTVFEVELEELPTVFSQRKNMPSDIESYNVAHNNVKICQQSILEYLKATNENISIAEVSSNDFAMRMYYSDHLFNKNTVVYNNIVKNKVVFRVVTKEGFDHVKYMNQFIQDSEHLKFPFYNIKQVNVLGTQLLSDDWKPYKSKLYHYEEVPFQKVKPKLEEKEIQHEEGIDNLKELLVSYELKEISRLRRLIPRINFDLPPDFEEEDSPQFWKKPCQWLKEKLIKDYKWKPKPSTEDSVTTEPENDDQEFESSSKNDIEKDLHNFSLPSVEISLFKCSLPSTGFSYTREEWEQIEISQSEFYELLHKEDIFETSEDLSPFDIEDSDSESDSENSDDDNKDLDHYSEYSE